MDRKPSSFVQLACLVAAVALVTVALVSIVLFKRESPPVPGCPVFGYEVTGVVFNRLTGERIAGAELLCTGCRAVSDERGRFMVTFDRQESRPCRVTAWGYEPLVLQGQVGRPLGVRLAPDPVKTVDTILSWEREADFGRQYDLLYPDIKRSWTREEYSRLMRQTQGRRILNVEHEPPAHLDTWDYFGDIFRNVIVVPTWITFEETEGRVRSFWDAHLVNVDGVWHWFGEPGA